MATAAATQATTTPSTTQIQVFTLPATGCLRKLPGFARRRRVAALLAERQRLERLRRQRWRGRPW